jgi:hypothetical protein
MAPSLTDIMVMPREQLREYKHYDEIDCERLSMGEGFRITIYERPKTSDTYVIGTDHCQGIEGADLDGAVVLNKATWPVRQVAELHGRWGPDRFDRLLYCMARYYMNAFICGERQFGLPVFRSLISNLHYHYIYYQRDEASRARSRSDVLGHYKGPGDPCIPMFRMAVRDKQVEVRSPVLWEELRTYQFRPKTEKDREEVRDADMKMGAPTGMHDDLVNAASYAWKGILEVHHYADDRPKIEMGRAGDMLGMKGVLASDKKGSRGSVFRGYGSNR